MKDKLILDIESNIKASMDLGVILSLVDARDHVINGEYEEAYSAMCKISDRFDSDKLRERIRAFTADWLQCEVAQAMTLCTDVDIMYELISAYECIGMYDWRCAWEDLRNVTDKLHEDDPFYTRLTGIENLIAVRKEQ